MIQKILFSLISGILCPLLFTASSSTEKSKIEEVYTKSADSSESLKNFSMTTEPKQMINMDSAEETDGLPTGGIPITSTIESEVQVEPVAFHQTVDTMGQTIEQYYSEDSLYLSLPTEDEWVKAPENVLEQMNAFTAHNQTHLPLNLKAASVCR